MLRVTLLVGLALALVGCKRTRLEDLRFDKVELLPGFEVGLPAGKRQKTETTSTTGRLVHKAGPAVIAVGWQTGRLAERDLAIYGQAGVARGAAPASAASEQRTMTLPAPNYGVEISHTTKRGMVLIVSIVQCVHSNVNVTLSTAATRERSEAIAFHASMMATFRCREDGPRLVAASGLPDFDTGNTVAYLPGSEPPTYHDLSGATWTTTDITGDRAKALMDPKSVAALFSTSGFEVVDQERVSHGADWLVFRLTAIIAGERGKLLLGVRTCQGGRSFLVLYENPFAMDQERDLRVLDRVRCPATPVDPESMPTVPARFGAACDGGNGQACAVLADLAAEEPTLLPGIDAAALRAKACKLGVAGACATP